MDTGKKGGKEGRREGGKEKRMERREGKVGVGTPLPPRLDT